MVWQIKHVRFGMRSMLSAKTSDVAGFERTRKQSAKGSRIAKRIFLADKYLGL